jgi:3-hydroxymyristoyl/3-hydroxydecanoyl-(acyl carrier protein) dehydratase
MNGRFRSFSFVDRITLCTDTRIEGHYTLPHAAGEFPASLMAEAVGQLAAWASMSQLDFAWRPVAGLAAEARYGQVPRPGQTLKLAAEIERCDAEAVAYSGCATIDGQSAVETMDCVGPMLPMEQFDAPEAVRADFATLCGDGASPDRFGGVPAPLMSHIEAIGGEQLQARLEVPTAAAAPYFDDHFPRRPVFPGTLLLDALAKLAVQQAQRCWPGPSAGTLVASRVTNVKIRAFTEPGTILQLEVALIDADTQRARLKLAARADDKTVATARVEVVPRPQA